MADEPNGIGFTDDELAHQRGQEAESFMKFIQDGEQYFLKLMSQLETEMINSILGLRPMDKELFTVYKAQLEGLYTPLQRVGADIEIGKQAFNRINGIEDENKGIL